MAPPLKSLYYVLRSNCKKFGAFTCFVPKSSKITTKQPDYLLYMEYECQKNNATIYMAIYMALALVLVVTLTEGCTQWPLARYTL